MRRGRKPKYAGVFDRECQIGRIHSDRPSHSAAASFLQTFQELSNLLPHFHTSGETFPSHPDEPDKLEAFVDWNDEVLFGGAYPIYEQAFNVTLHRAELGIFSRNLLPRIQSEHGLHRACGARVNRHDAIHCGVLEQEHDSDGNHHSVPLAIGHPELAQNLHLARNAAILLPRIAEKNRACVTDAHQFSIRLLDQMLVRFRQMSVAEIAELRRGW